MQVEAAKGGMVRPWATSRWQCLANRFQAHAAVECSRNVNQVVQGTLLPGPFGTGGCAPPARVGHSLLYNASQTAVRLEQPAQNNLVRIADAEPFNSTACGAPRRSCCVCCACSHAMHDRLPHVAQATLRTLVRRRAAMRCASPSTAALRGRQAGRQAGREGQGQLMAVTSACRTGWSVGHDMPAHRRAPAAPGVHHLPLMKTRL